MLSPMQWSRIRAVSGCWSRTSTTTSRSVSWPGSARAVPGADDLADGVRQALEAGGSLLDADAIAARGFSGVLLQEPCALLTAAYQRISERHLLAGGDPADVHRGLVEDAMIGCDIMPAAVHLTAARLSGEHPEIDYTATNTWVMPYGSTADVGGGGDVIKLGALDLQHSTSAMALWGDGSIAATSRGEVRHTTAHIDAESLDIVIMNPPFTRPTNHESAHSGIPNPAFAGLGNDTAAQAAMSRALQPIVAGVPEPRAGNGNAGLASNFVDLAHAKLKPGGVLALVLPAVAMSGGSWKQARRLLSERYSETGTSASPRSRWGLV